MFSSYSCWQQLVNQTKSLSKDHAALSEIYSVHLVARLQSVWDDVQRIYRKVSFSDSDIIRDNVSSTMFRNRKNHENFWGS